MLGLRLRGPRLYLDPCIPRAWRGFEITFRYHSSRYEIVVENPHNVAGGVSSVEFDGASLVGGAPIPLAEDGATQHVRVVLGSETTARAPSCDTRVTASSYSAQASCKIVRAEGGSQAATANLDCLCQVG